MGEHLLWEASSLWYKRCSFETVTAGFKLDHSQHASNPAGTNNSYSITVREMRLGNHASVPLDNILNVQDLVGLPVYGYYIVSYRPLIFFLFVRIYRSMGRKLPSCLFNTTHPPAWSGVRGGGSSNPDPTDCISFCTEKFPILLDYCVFCFYCMYFIKKVAHPRWLQA